MPVNDANLTAKSLAMINSMDNDILVAVQDQLAPLYARYPMLSYDIWGVPLANLIAALFFSVLILLMRKLFTRVCLAFFQKAAKRTKTYYDDRIISALKAPIRFAFVLVAIHVFFLLSFIQSDFITKILDTLVVFTLFWMILDIVEALREAVYKLTSRFNPDLSKEIGSFILAILKVLIGGVGLAAMLTVWGINVTALIASLGLGGLAFALAAKDTASNLFGSFALLVDKSIRIGEWVKVGGVEGVVEDVGMRTTKIRSFDKSLISVPNQLVATQPIENFSRRGIRRIKMHIGLTYGTTSEQLVAIKNEIETMLRNHEGISQKDTLLVYFDAFGASSLDIFIYTFTATANWAKYLEIKEDVHLKIMQIVEQNGSSFAFPSQSIYVESMPEKSE